VILAGCDHAARRLDQNGRARLALLLGKGVDLLKIGLSDSEVDLNAFPAVLRYRYGKGNGLRVFGMTHDVVKRRRLWDRLSQFAHALDVRFESLLSHRAGFLECTSRGDASREIREIDAEVAVRIFAKESDIRRQELPPPEFHARLQLDALDRANWDVLSGVRHRHDLLCLRMHGW
jgi:hypothetical protein